MEVPTVIGWLRPVILLPASCLVGLTAAQLDSILAHELAHIRRHDYLVNLLQSIVETFLFYHPAVWWVSRRVREERELCCDDLAVEICGDRVTYARALATLEELRLAPAQLALAAAGPPLLPRIRRLAGKSAGQTQRPAWPVAGFILLVLLAALAFTLRGNRVLAEDGKGQARSVATNEWLANETTTPPVQDLFMRWHPPTQVAQLQPTESLNGKMVVHTNSFPLRPGIQTIRAMLDRTRVDSIQYDHVPLEEVIKKLMEMAKTRDPDHIGLNFFVDRQVAAGIDPQTGLPATFSASQPDISSVTITIKPPLNNLRLTDVLDAIVRGADQPIRYSILDYAVIFRLGAPGEQLEVRTFRVDPNTFRQGLEGVTGVPFGNTSSGGNGGNGGGGGANQSGATTVPRVNVTTGLPGVTSGGNGPSGRSSSSAETQKQVRQFFASVGVDINTNNPANVGKMFVYNDRKGILAVRSTTNELQRLQAAIQNLGHTNLDVRVFHLNPDTFFWGLERFLGLQPVTTSRQEDFSRATMGRRRFANTSPRKGWI